MKMNKSQKKVYDYILENNKRIDELFYQAKIDILSNISREIDREVSKEISNDIYSEYNNKILTDLI